MKETMEDYISKNFKLKIGQHFIVGSQILCGYIQGIKQVIVTQIISIGKSDYIVTCVDEDSNEYTCDSGTIYINRLDTKASRILYVK